LFNMCGHGHFDMKAYEDYFAGKLTKHELTSAEIESSLAELNTPIPA
ncbi:MAG: TrpB-like pyridoxal-phosphate dependent enzyme, partial [Bacteroidetes bacterium]